jgi:hypothetical protein
MEFQEGRGLLVEFQEGRGLLELGLLLAAAFGLDVWRESRWECMPRVTGARRASTMSKSMAACPVGGLAARWRRVASRTGMRLMRQAVPASSWQWRW